ncbi:MAG: outer membrane protein assembly factor BamC [Betaproteobacteria bacterium]|nr:outer membrane protein assembly factor BamC [Betaproteobacteria bacterium]
MKLFPKRLSRTALVLAPLWLSAAFMLTGCESLTSLAPSKRIDYKSSAVAPSLELPPDLTTPRYDDRYNVATASGLAAQGATRSGRSDLLPTNPDAKIVRAGNQRWLVAKATPEQAWNTVRTFWQETGFSLAVEQPATGVMETDWAENRAEIPQDLIRRTLGRAMDIFYSTYKQDKFRTRIERGVEPGTVEIFVSHRGMEQVPTVKIDNSSPAGFAWAVMPPSPDLEAEMLTRLMVKFGAPEPAARAQVAAAAVSPERARVEKTNDGAIKLAVDDQFDRAWRRVGLALDRIGFTVVDRDRSRGVYFVRFADPDTPGLKKDSGFLSKLMFWKSDEKDKPEQYQIVVAETAETSVISVQNPSGAPDRTPASERILSLLKDQLK